MSLSEQALMRELASEIKGDGAEPLFRRKGVVQSTALGVSGYRSTIRLGGSTTDIANVPSLGSYIPVPGDVVEVIRDGPQLLIIGTIRTHKLPFTRVFRNNAFTLVNGVVTTLVWDTLFQQTSPLWNAGISPERLWADRPGLWHYQAHVRILAGAGRYAIWGYRNGSQFGSDDQPTSGTDDVDRQCSFTIFAEAGEYFEAAAYVFNPGNRAVALGNAWTWASLTFIGPS